MDGLFKMAHERKRKIIYDITHIHTGVPWSAAIKKDEKYYFDALGKVFNNLFKLALDNKLNALSGALYSLLRLHPQKDAIVPALSRNLLKWIYSSTAYLINEENVDNTDIDYGLDLLLKDHFEFKLIKQKQLGVRLLIIFSI